MLSCISTLRTCFAQNWYSDISYYLLGWKGLPRDLAPSYLAPPPRHSAYLPAHAFTPPASFINVFMRFGGTFQRATYRNARAHLLIVLLPTSSAEMQRITPENGSAFPSKGRPANLNELRNSLFVLRRIL